LKVGTAGQSALRFVFDLAEDLPDAFDGLL
jgi:hypothetical protein